MDAYPLPTSWLPGPPLTTTMAGISWTWPPAGWLPASPLPTVWPIVIERREPDDPDGVLARVSR